MSGKLKLQKNTGLMGEFLTGDTVAGSFPGAGGKDVSSYTIGGKEVVHAGAEGIEKHPTVQSDLITELEKEL